VDIIRMKTLVQTVLLVVIVFAVALAVDQVAPLKQFTAFLDQHPEPYRTITLVMALGGWALLIGAFVLGLWSMGRPMSEDEAQQFMRTSAGRPGQVRHFRGRAAGREFRRAATFREIKDAWRSGDWLTNPSWWPILLGLLGAPFALYGMFGYFLVFGAPTVKLVCVGALLYATARIVWGFWKA
jgi:hypothetical protein